MSNIQNFLSRRPGFVRTHYRRIAQVFQKWAVENGYIESGHHLLGSSNLSVLHHDALWANLPHTLFDDWQTKGPKVKGISSKKTLRLLRHMHELSGFPLVVPTIEEPFDEVDVETIRDQVISDLLRLGFTVTQIKNATIGDFDAAAGTLYDTPIEEDEVIFMLEGLNLGTDLSNPIFYQLEHGPEERRLLTLKFLRALKSEVDNTSS
jgi:hypothetical protein